jgi:hypothetical protein
LIDMKTNYGTLVVGDWPATAAKNASGASAVDGTPYDKNFIDQIWGWQKALMYAANLTPNGVQEDYNASQLLKAGQRIYGGPGELCLSMLNSTELALRRLLPLNGSIILIASYADLCAGVYVGDTYNATAPAFYKCTSDGTRSTSGTYMKMPDLRGLFPRALGTNGTRLMVAGGTHYYAGGTLPAEFIQDAMIGHYHGIKADYTSRASTFIYPNQSADGTSDSSYWRSLTATRAVEAITDGTHGTPNLDYENRPASFATQVCIRY